MVQYLYEADSDPILPEGTDRNMTRPGRQKTDEDDMGYTYDFPTTALGTASVARRKSSARTTPALDGKLAAASHAMASSVSHATALAIYPKEAARNLRRM